ncbi:MAG: hypothetical protein GY852_07715, partial [bacterium]|nr:hypothetical protein [bacterium]
HAAFTDEKGNLFTAWAPTNRTPGLGIFLFLHRGEPLEVTIVNVLTYVPEAGEIHCAFLMDAQSDEESYLQWYMRSSEEFGISTAQEFKDYFGDMEVNEPLFSEYEYLEETGASYKHFSNHDFRN